MDGSPTAYELRFSCFQVLVLLACLHRLLSCALDRDVEVGPSERSRILKERIAELKKKRISVRQIPEIYLQQEWRQSKAVPTSFLAESLAVRSGNCFKSSSLHKEHTGGYPVMIFTKKSNVFEHDEDLAE